MASSSPTTDVDAALRDWRTETDRRRAEWQTKSNVFRADQLQRRQRLYGVLAGLVTLSGLAAVVAVWQLPTTAEHHVAPPAVTVIPVRPVGPGAAAPRTVSPGRSVALLRPPRSWTMNGALWIQVDYQGDPMTLHWTDARGKEVLSPTPCVNRIPGGRRCYVGRSAEVVAGAIKAGAAPGVWTTRACQGDVCTDVASYQL